MIEARIKDIVRINREALAESTDPDYTFKYIDISSVDSRGGISQPEALMRFASSPSRARRLAAAGSTVVSTVRTYLRAVAIVPATKSPLVFSTGFAVLEPTSHVDSRYLTYYCQSEKFIGEVVARSTGVSYPAINPSEIGDLKMTLPALEEQRRIADFLDAETGRMDELSGLQTRTRELVLERRAGRVWSEVTGSSAAELRPSGVPWVAEIPADWDSARIGLLARMGSGHTPSRSRPEWWVDCDIPWVTTGEVGQVRDDRCETIVETREKISRLGIKNSSAEIHPAETVMLCRTASAGYSAVMGVDMATSQDYVTWACGDRLDPYYLLWCLRAMRRDLLGRLAMGSTHKTIYVPDLQMLKVPVPSIREQLNIVASIRESNAECDGLVDAIDRQLIVMGERRQALVTAAVTGRIDVTTARGVGVS